MNFIDIYQLLQVSFSTGIMLYGGPQIAVNVLVDDQFIQLFEMCIKDWLNEALPSAVFIYHLK